MKKRLISLALVLLMVLSLMPVTAMAATVAKPEKITLIGSDAALAYEEKGTLFLFWEDVPLYEVAVPTGTTQVKLYDSEAKIGTARSGYIDETTLEDWTPSREDWSTSVVGSSSPYTIGTQIGQQKNLVLVLHGDGVSSRTSYLLRFVEQKAPSAAPTISTNLSTDAVTYTYGDTATALSVTASSTAGTLSYQWQVSTTSATDGFADIPDATESTYTPATDTVGSFWYRVVVTNLESGKSAASVESAVTPVTVSAPAGKVHLKITTSTGYSAKQPMTFTLKDSSDSPVNLTRDTSTGYAVYDLWLAPGTYTYQATTETDAATYTLGTGSITVEDSTDLQTLELYLVYVYAQMSGWTAEDFTTEVKNSSGTVMTPGQAYKFAGYVGYPYLMAPGRYTYQIKPSKVKAAEGYQSTAAISQTLTPQKSNDAWSSKLTQIVATTFTVPKGAVVTVETTPTKPYRDGEAVSVTADTTGSTDIYTANLTAGISYVYRANGSGMVTNTGMFKASNTAKSFDLTGTMTGDPAKIDRTVTLGAADVRLNGVDHTGSLALAVGGTAQLTPLRMWQIANNQYPTNTTAYAFEPDFHYTVVDLDGSDVVSVDGNGKITANKAGTALILVTYDAMYVGSCGWSVNVNKTFSAIWPENTGVVVVEVGENASAGPNANMTIHSGTKKMAGNKLDAENDVIYYLDGQSCQYTFTPESGSTVTLLRPQLSETAMTYTGGFGTAGVETAASGAVTLTLTEGKNIVKISKNGADTYQVITAKKATVEITNLSRDGDAVMAGDELEIQLKGVYTPQNWMAYLSKFIVVVSYEDADGSKVKGTPLKDSYPEGVQKFDTSTGDKCRTFTITIPENWDASKPFTLTNGCLLLWGNGKDVGSYRNTLSSLNSSVPQVSMNAQFPMALLPEISIPVKALDSELVTFTVTDDASPAAKLDGCSIKLTCPNYEARTWTTVNGSVTANLPYGTWSYTITKTGYQPVSGTVTVSDGSAPSVSKVLNKVTGITITSEPTTKTYIEGSTLSTSGLVVTAQTASGSYTLKSSDYVISPTTLNTVGDAQTITVSYAGFTRGFTVKVVENKPTIETTLPDGITQKNSRRTFDVFAKDYFGKKVKASEVSVKLNGNEVGETWDDDVKTSYTLKFTQEGENIVTVTAGKTTKTYTIQYVKVAPGESVGKAVFAIEALTLGGGYIIEPVEVDILEGENGAEALIRLLEENELEYSNTGSIGSTFYLAALTGDALAEIDVTGNSIPAELKALLAKNGFTVSPRSDEAKLGEFDYTSGSGWMVTHNNVFPNVGFSDIYLSDGDVIRLHFTLTYGADVGGGYAVGDSGGSGYYEMANKDELTALLAKAGASYAPDATPVATKLYATQAEVDAAVAKLKQDMAAAKPVEEKIKALPRTLTLESGSAIAEAEAAYAALTDAQQRALVKDYADLTRARTAYNRLVDQAAADAVKAKISAIGEVTLESKNAIEEAEAAYQALTGDQKALVENYDALTAARAAYDKLAADKAAADAVIARIDAIGNVTLNSRDVIDAAREAYDALTPDQKELVTNYDALTAAEARFAQLKRQTALIIGTAISGASEPKAEFPFTDVAETAWYYDEVKSAWENGLIDGMNGYEFQPENTLTVAQAIKLAAALHQMDQTGEVTLKNGAVHWFDTYVEYAVENRIIEAKYAGYSLAQMNAPISRAEFVHIFHGAMSSYYACNAVADHAIPDVKSGDAYADEIYTFYRAGILTGSDSKGTFHPASSIKRCEVAAILIRMYDTNARQAITLG